jgi:hypothetical protein
LIIDPSPVSDLATLAAQAFWFVVTDHYNFAGALSIQQSRNPLVGIVNHWIRKLQFLNKLFHFRCGILKIRINPDEGNGLLGKELPQGLKPSGIMPGNRAFDADKEYDSKTVGLGERNLAAIDGLCFPIRFVFRSTSQNGRYPDHGKSQQHGRKCKPFRSMIESK